MGFPGGSEGKESAYNAGLERDMGLIPGSGRSPGGGHGHPENLRGQWKGYIDGIEGEKERLEGAGLHSIKHSSYNIRSTWWQN